MQLTWAPLCTGIPELLKHPYVTGAHSAPPPVAALEPVAAPAAAGISHHDLEALLVRLKKGEVQLQDVMSAVQQVQTADGTATITEMMTAMEQSSAHSQAQAKPTALPPAAPPPPPAAASAVTSAAPAASARPNVSALHMEIKNGKENLKKSAEQPSKQTRTDRRNPLGALPTRARPSSHVA